MKEKHNSDHAFLSTLRLTAILTPHFHISTSVPDLFIITMTTERTKPLNIAQYILQIYPAEAIMHQIYALSRASQRSPSTF